VQLPLRTVPPRINPENLATIGIKEQVATFTTNHPAGQPRVTNIHRMADMVKGQVIMPGETFSLNGFVGERTVAKGFVVDHQINDEGKFDEAVGGGVSQFATTTFNAAFFGGLDYGEYQSHTIYISRYPFGREATVSWRHPDLQLKNSTPYAVGIWATYTDTTLTVSLYSTRFLASVTQSAQSSAPFGPGCTKVTTERTRRYLDGRVAVDHVFALYQPAEGVKCR
jgi:vancomycin resistance protein YoaR